MLLQNYYYYYPGLVGDRFCDQVKEFALAQPEEKATTTDLTHDISNFVRQSNIVWTSETWISRQLHYILHNANAAAGWNYQWDATEAIQFSIYKPGQYYDWHCDTPKRPNKNNKIRKLSLTLSLSDPKEYRGGELEFDFRDGSKPVICEQIKTKGSVVVFPGFLYHRVKPVLEGTRHSLVCWAVGNPWK